MALGIEKNKCLEVTHQYIMVGFIVV